MDFMWPQMVILARSPFKSQITPIGLIRRGLDDDVAWSLGLGAASESSKSGTGFEETHCVRCELGDDPNSQKGIPWWLEDDSCREL